MIYYEKNPMDLKAFLRDRKGCVLKRWFDLVADTYPAGGALLLREGEDRFRNPIKYSISDATEAIYEGLLEGKGYEKLAPSLDELIRLRAVQGFSPSQAVSFIFLLKRAIREELEGEKNPPLKDLLKLEDEIDKIALLAFDIYMSCRERIYQIRVERAEEEKRSLLRLIEKGK